MTEHDDDALEEFLRVLRTGEGNERLKQLARAMEEGERRRREGPPERAEAREWLASNKREHPIAVNHFHVRGAADRFVHALYEAGAVGVFVDNIAYDDSEEWGGPYSDTVIVDLPEEPAARARVIALCNEHCLADSATGARFVDSGQDALHLWWD